MAVEAKPYREGSGFAIRFQIQGEQVYLSGYRTAAAASQAAGRYANAVKKHGHPEYGGAKKHTVAKALSMQAGQTLRFKKGGEQEARRVNAYLRHAGLDEIVLKKISKADLRARAADAAPCDGGNTQTKSKVYFEQSWRPAHAERTIPGSLRAHRKLLTVKSATSDRWRAQIARTRMDEISSELIQKFVNALMDEGAAAATVHLEVAVLRQLFNHARRRWRWMEPETNPVSGVDLPTIDNARTRTMSPEEQERLIAALSNRRNRMSVDLLALAAESAMRADELIELTWSEVDLDRSLLPLGDGKAGARDVPLSPAAVELLLRLKAEGAGSERVFPGMTYATLAAAWRRSCEEAGVTNLRFHDVRATAATRFALGPAGRNIFLVQALTGHKTLKMLERYVRINASDVVTILREQHKGVQRVMADAPTFETPPLATQHVQHQATLAERATPTRAASELRVVHVDFRRRRAG